MATPKHFTTLGCCSELSRVASLQKSTTRSGVNSMQNRNLMATYSTDHKIEITNSEHYLFSVIVTFIYPSRATSKVFSKLIENKY